MLLRSVEFVLLKENLKAQGTCTISNNSKLATLNPFSSGILGMWICDRLLCALESVLFKEN